MAYFRLLQVMALLPGALLLPAPQRDRALLRQVQPAFGQIQRMEKVGQITHKQFIIFTADLRRQLANDRCNSSSFPFSLVVTSFFFVLLWRCGTSDDRHATLLRSAVILQLFCLV